MMIFYIAWAKLLRDYAISHVQMYFVGIIIVVFA